jgi:hypothetical protein
MTLTLGGSAPTGPAFGRPDDKLCAEGRGIQIGYSRSGQ